MKLKTTHFYDPKPRRYYKGRKKADGLTAEFIEWKRRNEKPKVVRRYFTDQDTMLTAESKLEHDFTSDDEAMKALEYYNENRLRFEGFEKVNVPDPIEGYRYDVIMFKNWIGTTITFKIDKSGIERDFLTLAINDKEGDRVWLSETGEMYVEELNLICKNRGIDLKEI